MTSHTIDHKKICAAFGVEVNGHALMPFGHGLINQTFLLKDRLGSDDWILQLVNTHVFREPGFIAWNNYLASQHLKEHHPDYLFMSHRRTLEHKDLFTDEQGGAWRVFPYIQNSASVEHGITPQQAFKAAQQFGRLTHYLDGVYVSAFKSIIPGFHDLAARFDRFKSKIANADTERKSRATDAISFFLDQSHIVEEFRAVIADPDVSTRITHNDTKLNNVLFDKDSGEAICVVDLDTLMPGKALFDLGDMIRTFICTAAEDDPDPAHITINPDVFEQLIAGWLSEMAPLLSAKEKSLLFWSGQMLMYEQGIRFLTDHLDNDGYYKVDHPDHNLHRAKNQMHLLAAYSAREKELRERIERVVSGE